MRPNRRKIFLIFSYIYSLNKRGENKRQKHWVEYSLWMLMIRNTCVMLNEWCFFCMSFNINFHILFFFFYVVCLCVCVYVYMDEMTLNSVVGIYLLTILIFLFFIPFVRSFVRLSGDCPDCWQRCTTSLQEYYFMYVTSPLLEDFGNLIAFIFVICLVDRNDNYTNRWCPGNRKRKQKK